MAVKSTRRKELAKKKEAKLRAMAQPGFISKYARKHAYLTQHQKWGWEYPLDRKPWK
jgi:hypothetical protein